MSHWLSIGDGIPIQYRDNYTGEVEGDLREYMILDVAVSPGVQPNIRLSTFDMPAGGYSSLQLTCTQAVQLRQMLQRAIDAIPEDDSAEDGPQP